MHLSTKHLLNILQRLLRESHMLQIVLASVAAVLVAIMTACRSTVDATETLEHVRPSGEPPKHSKYPFSLLYEDFELTHL